jgi:DNA-binding transcriptional ArsR family regulator
MAVKTRRRAGGVPASDPGRFAQVRALAHPLRLRLFELFALAPRTTKQAALELGQPPTRLYHHVATLERAGLVRVRETRPNRGTIEKYYETAVSGVVSGHRVRSAAPGGPARAGSAALARGRWRLARAVGTVRDQAALGMLVLDQTREEFVRALGALEADFDPQRLPLMARFTVGTRAGTQARVRRVVMAFVRELLAIEGARRVQPGEPTWSLTVAMLPSAAAPAASEAARARPARRTGPGPARSPRARKSRVRGA